MLWPNLVFLWPCPPHTPPPLPRTCSLTQGLAQFSPMPAFPLSSSLLPSPPLSRYTSTTALIHLTLLVFQISALTLGQVPLLFAQGTMHFLYHSIITGATPCYRLSVYILSLPKGSKLDMIKNQNVIPHCICIPGHNTVSIRVQTEKIFA